MLLRDRLYPQRIVCLTEETTEILYLLGEEDRIVGISGFTVRPRRARKEKPKVSAFVDADIPAIEALEPDLVLAFSDIQADITRELVKRGHTVVTFNQRSITEILRAIVSVAALVGRQQDGEELARQLASRLEAVRIEGAALPHRPRVYFEEWPDPMISGIRWVSELVAIAGGEDICGELSHASLAGERIVDPAEIISRQPDVILASWCGKKVRIGDICSRPGWAEIEAVRNGHVYEIDSSIILQPGPASLTDGLDVLHQRISQVARS